MKRTSITEAVRNVRGWVGARKPVLVAIVVIAVLVIPQSSQSQILPSPCCAILSVGLSSIASAITNVVGGALDAINSTMSSIDAFQRAVVWPQKLIDEAKAVVGAVQGIFTQIRQLGQIHIASATLPTTQELEQTLLSGNAAQISS